MSETNKTEDHKPTKAEVAEARKTLIRSRIEGDSTTGVLKMTDGDNLLHTYLPEGMTAETIKAVDNARQSFVADMVDVAADVALGLYKDNKDLTQVNGEFAMSNSRERLRTMFSKENGMSISIVNPITNVKAGALKETTQRFAKEIDELFNV